MVRVSALLITLIALNGDDHPETALVVRSEQFGVVEPQDAPDQADALGVGWGRVRLHWAEIQPEGPQQWIEAEVTSEELALEQASSRETVGLLIGIPAWARGSNGLPKGLYLADDNTDNLWAAFVREAVTRYALLIDHWIIWNEPDVWDAQHPGFTWPGSEADYLQLLKVAYRVSKAENAEAVIHLAAVSHWWDALYGKELYFTRLLDILMEDPEAVEHNYYYDAATLHLYFNPADIYSLLNEYRDIQMAHGLDKPIWLIETNAAPSNDPARPVEAPAFRVSLLEQAAYMPQALSLAVAGGADHIAIYKLIDTPGDIAANPEPFGLVRPDGAPRPGFATAQVAVSQLDGASAVTWTEQGIASQVVIEKRNTVTRLLWSRIPQAQQVRLPALANEAVLLDMWGNEQVISPEGGSYTIILHAGECQQTTGDYCMIGGPPVYLIEVANGPVAADALNLSVSAWHGNDRHQAASQMRQSLGIWICGGFLIGMFALAGTLMRARTRHH